MDKDTTAEQGPDGAADIVANTNEAEQTDTIQVGAGGTLVVPQEDIGADIVDGTDMGIAGMLPKRIRKPGRREWIKVRRNSELQTRLLIHRPNPEAMDIEHYYVDKDLRLPIAEELKSVRVFQYYSLSSTSHGLWVINVNPDNRWYESLNVLLRQDAGFFDTNAVRIVSDKAAGLYHVKFKPVDIEVTWPDATTQELLGEALGANRFITTPDHPVYVELTDGKDLS